ncbi:MAG: cupin-like domain-containing protein [Pseudomonadota bacterium]
MQPATVELDSLEALREHIAEGEHPALLRGAARQWAAVNAAGSGDETLMEYLRARDTGEPVYAILGRPEIHGSFGFQRDARSVNYAARQSPLSDVLARFPEAAQGNFAIAVQAAPVRQVFRDWDVENPCLWLPESVPPTMWVSMASCVAPHSDVHDNVAVVVAGSRRFTLYAPEEIDNLYLGPLLSSPGGVPTSSVDIREPDLERHPRYADAAARAMRVTLNPGDALYIPALWWHAVESLETFNVLVNYWFGDSEENALSMPDTLAHAILAISAMPRAKRQRWHTYFEHLVFRLGEDPADHLPRDLDDLLTKTNPEQTAGLLRRIAVGLHSDEPSER